MGYFKIGISYDTKVTGLRNKIYQVEILENQFSSRKEFDIFLNNFYYDNADGFRKLNDYKILVKLLKGAKKVDFMEISPNLPSINFVISQKALSVLNKSKLKEYITIPLTFTNDDIKEPYFLFKYPFTAPENIDFSLSKIYTGDERLGNKLYHHVKDWDDYRDFKGNFPLSSFEKIVLVSEEQKYDLLSIRAGGAFLSEKLENLIVEHKLTGLDILKDSTQLDFSD